MPINGRHPLYRFRAERSRIDEQIDLAGDLSNIIPEKRPDRKFALNLLQQFRKRIGALARSVNDKNLFGATLDQFQGRCPRQISRPKKQRSPDRRRTHCLNCLNEPLSLGVLADQHGTFTTDQVDCPDAFRRRPLLIKKGPDLLGERPDAIPPDKPPWPGFHEPRPRASLPRPPRKGSATPVGGVPCLLDHVLGRVSRCRLTQQDEDRLQ